MILVTGATGFLGSFICRKLYEEKEEFIALRRANSTFNLLDDIKDDITWHEGDIIDIESMNTVIEKVDTVIHAAAVVSFHRSERDQMLEANITGTKNLINLCLKHKVDNFVHISSVAALGRNQPSGEIDESNKWQDSKWNTHYGESKYLAELEVWRGHAEGLNTVILNPSVILGPGDWERSSTAIFNYVWKEKQFYTEGWLNYVDVRDVTTIIHKILSQHDKFGERYILNGGHVSFGELFRSIAKRFDKKPPSINANHPLLIKFGVFIEWLKSIFSGKRPLVTRETARVSNSRIYFNNSKVVRELNHTFASLDNTLDWVCGQFAKNKK